MPSSTETSKKVEGAHWHLVSLRVLQQRLIRKTESCMPSAIFKRYAHRSESGLPVRHGLLSNFSHPPFSTLLAVKRTHWQLVCDSASGPQAFKYVCCITLSCKVLFCLSGFVFVRHAVHNAQCLPAAPGQVSLPAPIGRFSPWHRPLPLCAAAGRLTRGATGIARATAALWRASPCRRGSVGSPIVIRIRPRCQRAARYSHSGLYSP